MQKYITYMEWHKEGVEADYFICKSTTYIYVGKNISKMSSTFLFEAGHV